MDSSEYYKCGICNIVLNKTPSSLIVNHLRSHNIRNRDSIKSYYDTYLKKDFDGICTICGKSTPFINLIKGYKKCCSHSCATTLQMRRHNHLIGRPYSKKMREKHNKKLELLKQKYEEEINRNKKIIENAINYIFPEYIDKIDINNQCIFCKKIYKNLGCHITSGHKIITMDEYKNLFIYKRKSKQNKCIECGNNINAEGTRCIKCISMSRQETWKNRSEDKNKFILEKLHKGRNENHPYGPRSDETKRKISKNSI